MANDRNQKDPWKEGDFWGWFTSTKPPDRREKEVLIGGAIVFGGGGKSGRKRSKVYPKGTVWTWFEM